MAFSHASEVPSLVKIPKMFKLPVLSLACFQVNSATTTSYVATWSLAIWIIGSMQAMKAIKLLAGIDGSLKGKLMVCDFRDIYFITIDVFKRLRSPTLRSLQRWTHVDKIVRDEKAALNVHNAVFKTLGLKVVD